MGVLGGLGAALGWGIADFFAREAGQREGSLKALLYLQLVGTPAAALLVLFGEGDAWERVFSPAGLAGALIALLFTVGTILLYSSLAAGPLLIVAPVSSSFAAVTVALSLLTGERPGTITMIGMLVTLVGVVLAAVSTGEVLGHAEDAEQGFRWMSPGVVLALLAALVWGVGMWVYGMVAPALGDRAVVFVTRSAGLVYVLILFLATGRPLRPQSRSSLKWLLPIGVLDTAGSWSVSVGVISGLTSVVSVMASLYGVVTVILGYVIAGERVSRIQQVGIVATFIGVALVSL